MEIVNKEKKILIDKVNLFIFDFDGVLTDNLVRVDEHGMESVVCNRADGLAFKALNKLKKKTYILSSEKNIVVKQRAKKLKIPVMQGVSDKGSALNKLAADLAIDLSEVLYVGNDINDHVAMQLCGYSACPQDSHKSIKKQADFVLKKRGGEGVVRELLEEVLGIDLVDILY